MFDLELENIVAWIRNGGFTSVALQLPEGLKLRATEISDRLSQDTGADVLILGYPCYGACDLFIDYHRYADALVHFGHSPIPSQGNDPNVMYVEAKASPDILEAVSFLVPLIPQNIGLLATVQYVNLIPKAKEILEGMGKKVFVGTGDKRICYPGQVLGCNCSTATAIENKVDAFLFLGEGDFHPLAAAFGVKKPLIVLNPLTGEIRSVDDIRDRILRKRFAAIESSLDAESFLVIVCGKVGQNRSIVADDIIIKLKAAGKKVYKVMLDEITPTSLISYQVDAYVNTACPRIAMDDSVRYSHPMLTVTEVEVVLGLRKWDDYSFDSI
ncbi:MAG: diphthamide biosynthesis enzyme Dph2 [Candidatus Methanomethylophilaceae archaeon]|nr:diphthamide biosynthesis enzyme Dph2 [Candidatus Methanomethylophilaceae archaeon]